jgi:hypothetical protein
MSGTDLRELLKNRAANAATPPADLIERVEAGHRRRRRGQAAVATFLSVLVLAAGAWVALRPGADRHPQLPATPPTPAAPRPFHVPGSMANPPALKITWPGTTMVDQPLPDRIGRPLGRIDQDHLLLGDTTTFSSYDVTTRTTRTLVSGTGAKPHGSGILFTVAIAPHWIIWQADDQQSATAFSVYRAPITGGPRQLVAVVHASVENQGYYATDDFVYWSPIRHGGVTRLSLTDGTIRVLPGFEGIWSDGTGWGRDVGRPRNQTATAEVKTPKAAAPISFRSLVTGELRAVTRSRDLTGMQCVPTFCIGASAGSSQEFVQRLDGSGRVALPATGHRIVAVLQVGDGGLIAYGLTLLDPLTGRVGAAQTPDGPCGRTSDYLQRATVIDWWDRSNTSCVSGAHHAYLAAD